MTCLWFLVKVVLWINLGYPHEIKSCTIYTIYQIASLPPKRLGQQIWSLFPSGKTVHECQDSFSWPNGHIESMADCACCNVHRGNLSLSCDQPWQPYPYKKLVGERHTSLQILSIKYRGNCAVSNCLCVKSGHNQWWSMKAGTKGLLYRLLSQRTTVLGSTKYPYGYMMLW